MTEGTGRIESAIEMKGPGSREIKFVRKGEDNEVSVLNVRGGGI